MNPIDLVIQLLADYLGVDGTTISPSTDLRRDLALDSLDLIELVILFERRFGSGVATATQPTVPVLTVGEFSRVLAGHGKIIPSS